MDHLHADERREPSSVLDWGIDSHPRAQKHVRPSLGWKNIKAQVLSSFDRCMPPHRRYCGLRRKFASTILFVMSIIILALILGLAIGLTRRSRYVNPTTVNMEWLTEDQSILTVIIKPFH